MKLKNIIFIALVVSVIQAKEFFTPEDKQSLVAAHNYRRSLVSPTAADMRAMSWSNDLEASAQELANECSFNHGTGDVSNRVYKHFGQNIWSGTGGFNVNGSVFFWDSEKKDFTFSTKHCTSVCGHYTQVVWASSFLVGCGMKLCKKMKYVSFENAHFVVCNYHEQGNFKGEAPYKEGTPCSACPADANKCSNNLCVASTPKSPVETVDAVKKGVAGNVPVPVPPGPYPDLAVYLAGEGIRAKPSFLVLIGRFCSLKYSRS